MSELRTPEAFKDELAQVRTLGQKVSDVTDRLRSIGGQLGLQASDVSNENLTYLDGIITQIEECRSWIQAIGAELDRL